MFFIVQHFVYIFTRRDIGFEVLSVNTGEKRKNTRKISD